VCWATAPLVRRELKHHGAGIRCAPLLSRQPVHAAVTAAKEIVVSTFTDAVDDQALLREVLGFYRRKLQETPDALAWLQGHAITSPEVIERFQLGLSDRTLGLALPEGNRKAGAEVRGRLQRLGVLRDSGHEHFAGALVVPVLDAQGAVVQVYGRLIGASLRTGTVRDLYLPGPRRGVWNLAAFTEPQVVLCGGLLDALTVWSAGVTSVTAAFSLDEVPAEIVQVARARGVRTVLVAYPRHEQGDKAAGEVSQALQAAGMTACRVELPGGAGVNELARRRGTAAVLDALEHARPRTSSSVSMPVPSAQGAQEGAPPALGTIPAMPAAPPAVSPDAEPVSEHADAADLVIEGMAQNEYRFTRKTVREATGWGDTQLKIHLRRLVDLEHLVVHRSGRGHAYEFVYDGRGQDGQRFLAGLLDPEKLLDAERSGSGRPSVGPVSGVGQSQESGRSASGAEGMRSQAPEQAENAQPAPASEPHVVPAHVVAGEGA
jgi:hypothetical protein